VRQLATAVAERLTFWLPEEQMSTAARCSCHRHIGKVAAVGAQEPIEGFDAVVAARMPIAVNDDEASAPNRYSCQRARLSAPPLADLLWLCARLFLPANEHRALVGSRRENRHTRSGQTERGSQIWVIRGSSRRGKRMYIHAVRLGS